MESSIKRPASQRSDDMCFVCMTHKKIRVGTNSKTVPTVAVANVEEVRIQYEKWLKKVDCPENILPAISSLREAFSNSDNPSLKWHTHTCRPNFVSSVKLSRYSDKVEPLGNESASNDDQDSLNTSTRVLRSHMTEYSKDEHCVICCCGEEKGGLCKVLTFNKHEQLQKLATKDSKMMVRLQRACDAIAGDILYHPVCLLSHAADGNKGGDHEESDSSGYTNVYTELTRELKSLTSCGHAVLVSVCWERFEDLCDTYNVGVPYYFIVRRSFFLNKLCDILPTITIIPKQGSDEDDGLIISSSLSQNDIRDLSHDDKEDIKLAPYNDNEMLHMVHVALYLNKLIHEQTPNDKTLLTEENAYASIPEALYIFMALMHGGSEILDTDGEEEPDMEDDSQYNIKKFTKLRRQILDICQDIVYNVTRGKVIPPKQYAVPMAAHHLTRSKPVVELINKAMPSIPYPKVLEADNAIVEDTMKSMDPRTGAVLPSNLVHGRPVRLSKDNIDTDKESKIAGHSAGFHGTQTVAYQPGPAVEIDVSPMRFIKDVPEIPEYLHAVLELDRPIKKNPPYVITEQDVDSILDCENSIGSKEFNTSTAKDMAFVIYREKTDRYNDKKSDWTELNKFLYKDQVKPATIVGQTPILNAKADAHNTIYTIGERGKFIVNALGEEHVFFTVDQGIHGPAMEVKFTLGDEWDNVHYRLGGLHWSNAFMDTIGDHIAGSEIPEMWVNAGIITEGSADKILHGNDYKAGMRMHKITLQAAWRLLLPQLMVFLEQSYPDMFQDVNSLMVLKSIENPLQTSEDVITPLITRCDKNDFRDAVEDFLAMKKEDKNFQFFWSYMEMVGMLLAYTRADRTDDWPLHVNSVTRMLGPYGRYDHQRYLKSGIIYRVELFRLPADVLDSLISEGFGVTWNDDSPFTTVSDDHATEWVNGLSKSAAGLKSITQVDSATLKWVLSHHSRNVITAQTMEYYGIGTKHKDHISNSELKLEAEYEDQLVAEFTRNHLFEGRNPEKLTTFMNKDVASQAIEDSLLDMWDLGDDGVRTFMLNRLVGAGEENKPAVQFSARLSKVKAPTFLKLFDVEKSPGNLTEQQIVRADRKIFKRLVTAQLAGREVDFQEAARYEAFSVPIALFKTDKTMRGGTKSTLVTPILKSAGVDKLHSIPPKPASDSQHGIDVMCLVNSTPITEDIKTFHDFSDIICNTVYSMPSNRIDAACDRYDKLSPKGGTRNARATQTKKASNKKSTKKKMKKVAVEKVLTPELAFPANEKEFKLFLTLDKNKERLQMLLGTDLIENAPPNKTIVVTGAFEDPTEVRSNKLSPGEIRALECDHEEADTRLVFNIVNSTCPRSVLWGNDTDYLFSLLSSYSRIKHKEVYMRRAKNDYLDIIAVAKGLIAKGINLKSMSLMHTISGCDQVSYVYGIGKPTAWKTYLEHHHLLDEINPADPTEQDFTNAEKFMCREFNSIQDTLDEVRVTTLLATTKPEDNPPTSNAARFHICRAFCQAAKFVNASQPLHSDLPSPVASGGFKEEAGHLIPIMLTTESMPDMIQELITCNCQGNCRSRNCNCKKRTLKCTLLCHKQLKYNHDNCLNKNTD